MELDGARAAGMQDVLLAYPVVGANAARVAETSGRESRRPRFGADRKFTPGRGLARPPMYLADLAIWLGWVEFYGSVSLAGVIALAAQALGPVILPREERGLEARFGDAYREFRRTTPHWLGKARR